MGSLACDNSELVGNKGKEKEDEDEELVPTVEALSGLQQFHEVQKLKKDHSLSCNGCTPSEYDLAHHTEQIDCDLWKYFPEDWQMSQFWYDEDTTKFLTNEVKRLISLEENPKVACISCPSVFQALYPSKNIDLFEFDKRFEAYGEAYHFYDYNNPELFPESLKQYYSVIIFDPPFLSDVCLEKMSLTVKGLAQNNAKIILCTAEKMEPFAKEFLDLNKSSFVPSHRNNDVRLECKFGCFTNYDLPNSPN